MLIKNELHQAPYISIHLQYIKTFEYKSVAVNRSRVTSLDGISNDDNINKDTRFLDAIKKAFDEYKTSTVFKPHTTKMKLAFVDATRSLKRRIKKTESHVVEETERGEADSQESDEERNLFDTLCNEKPSFLSFLVLNCIGNICSFVEKKKKKALCLV